MDVDAHLIRTNIYIDGNISRRHEDDDDIACSSYRRNPERGNETQKRNKGNERAKEKREHETEFAICSRVTDRSTTHCSLYAVVY